MGLVINNSYLARLNEMVNGNVLTGVKAIINRLSSYSLRGGIIYQVTPVLAPHGLGMRCRLCERLCECIIGLLSLASSLTLLNKNSIQSCHRKRSSSLEDTRDSLWLLRYWAELGMPLPLHWKLFLECSHAVLNVKSEENRSSVILCHNYCLED